jgi:hypothetical protein
MFNPTGLRVKLFKFLLGNGNGFACLIKEDSAGTGCPLVKGEDVSLAHQMFSGKQSFRAATS